MPDKISTANAEHYLWGRGCYGWHLVKEEQLSVIQESVPPGQAEAAHYHKRANQFFFVLSGEASLEVDQKLHKLGPNQGLYIPSGSHHQLRNEAQTELVFLVISTPKSHGDRIEV